MSVWFIVVSLIISTVYCVYLLSKWLKTEEGEVLDDAGEEDSA